ncbi:MAG: helix-turn-helix domain-containing protein [Tepidisphaeraceae bacterium]
MTNYSAYYPDSGAMNPWGVRVTAAGHTQTVPGALYPPGRHPDDYALDWQRGRVLNAYQLVYITAGQGRFESARSGKARIEPGTVFVLFPGVWHRYEPLRQTGWTEDWLELQGPAVDRLRRAGVLRPERPLLRPGLDLALSELFDECHRITAAAPKGYSVLLGLLGLQFLARVVHGRQRRTAGAGAPPGVTALRCRISECSGVGVSMQNLAEESGLSYSYIRRAFKAHTGVTPKQYHIQVRLRRAQDLLQSTQLSVKEIAARLGFDSPFHFSIDFKRHTGLAPMPWRARLRAPSASKTSSRTSGL